MSLTFRQLAERDAFWKKFPWVRDFVDLNNMRRWKVSRIDNEFLESSLKLGPSFYDGDRVGDQTGPEMIYLLNAENKVVSRVGYIPAKTTYRRWNPLTWRDGAKVFEESVSDCLARLGGQSGEVTHALQLVTVEGGYFITVHKSPRGFNLDNWIEQLRRNAENALEQQVRAAESVA